MNRRHARAAAVTAVLSLLAFGVALDWAAAKHVGTIPATVETFGRRDTRSRARPYVVVDLGSRGIVQVSNPSRLAATRGDRVELDEWAGFVTGHRWWVVRSVLPQTAADARNQPADSPPTDREPGARDLAVAGSALLVLSLACLVHLWLRQRAPLLRKLGWSLVLFVPLFGPVFYYALFVPLPAQPEHLKATENEYLRPIPGLGDLDDPS